MFKYEEDKILKEIYKYIERPTKVTIQMDKYKLLTL